MTPEFSRPYKLDTLGQPRAVDIRAEAEERTGLARRFGLQSLDRLEARATLTTSTQGIEVAGRLRADAVQSCVVTQDPIPVRIDQEFTVRFVPETTPDADEIELSADDCDIMEHDGQQIDLGEAVAQSLGLALDPYPRSANAEARLREAGVKSEEEAGPFGALAALKDKLQGK
ncbi:MAG: DUF177 domain-containing protein [Sphingomonadaceae bacterium]|jgi:uncharacterized metal-binding protein YceD (DUF177 family)|nr:DUF177 domain-containing protein [Sphingomonadaceae bacterium]NBU78205.1 DUF177 domain-containing protein [Sphingomonadaceae bacterium]NCA01331.1 DUF177 domain-containing protein [Sphingomonadaceae bacterium]